MTITKGGLYQTTDILTLRLKLGMYAARQATVKVTSVKKSEVFFFPASYNNGCAVSDARRRERDHMAAGDFEQHFTPVAAPGEAGDEEAT